MTFQTDGKKGANQTVRVHLPPRTLQVGLQPMPSCVFVMAWICDAVQNLGHSNALLLSAGTMRPALLARNMCFVFLWGGIGRGGR